MADQAWRARRVCDQPLCIEIGAGAGLHAIQFAQAHPENFLVALERTEEKSNKMLRRLRRHQGLDNLFAHRADAIQWVWQNIQTQEVSQYFLLYPNPHPKQSQANQRWINMPFFAYLIETLKVGGTILMATNIQSYFDEVCERSITCWNLELTQALILQEDFSGRTHFERKYLARGQSCYQCVLTRV